MKHGPPDVPIVVEHFVVVVIPQAAGAMFGGVF
jgi:hypothetical protein